MTTEDWVLLSNIAVYTAMFILVLAMVFFAASFAGRTGAGSPKPDVQQGGCRGWRTTRGRTAAR